MRESGPHLAGDHGVHPQNIPDGRLEVGRAVVALQEADSKKLRKRGRPAGLKEEEREDSSRSPLTVEMKQLSSVGSFTGSYLS